MGFSENTGITGLNNEKQARSKEIYYDIKRFNKHFIIA